ncbi:MAG: hypothetical protein Q9163_001150 [Psora crenata]
MDDAYHIQFSNITTARSIPRLGTSRPQLTPELSLRGRCRPSPLRELSATRFVSTAPIATPTNDLSTPTNPPSTPTVEVSPQNASAVPQGPQGDLAPSYSFDALMDTSPQVSEHIGYLKELGLDYGWGPTAMIEWLLEHVYIYTGFPWWGSIIFTAVAVRLCLLKFYIDASDTTAKMQMLKPAMVPLTKRITKARMNQDRVELMKANQERYEMFKAAGIKFHKMAIPLIQLPLGFGTFRLLRGMGYLPVPGFDQGGFLWFKDLTMPDPYGILPLMTSMSYFFAFHHGTASGDVGSGMSQSTLALFKYIIPVVTAVFSLFFPSALQLTLFTTSIFTVSQSYIFRQPGFRRFMNMHSIPPPPKPDPTNRVINVSARRKGRSPVQQAEKKTGWAAVRQTMETAVSDLKRKGKEMQGQYVADQKSVRRSEVEKKQAKAYEEKRQKELAQGRFHNLQRRR